VAGWGREGWWRGGGGGGEGEGGGGWGQRVPDPQRAVAVHHDLVAALASVASATDDDRHLGMLGMDRCLDQPVVLQGREIRLCYALQCLEGRGALQRHERRVGGYVAYLHIHAVRVLDDVVVVLVRLGDVDHPAEVH